MENPYRAQGYKSNELDENQELNKLGALNAITCHQRAIESLENTQIKLQ